MYYKLKTSFLSQTFTDVFDENEENDSFDPMNLSQVSTVQAHSSFNISSAINELLDTQNSLPNFLEEPQRIRELPSKNIREFEASDHLTTNEDAWSDKLNKPKPKEKLKETKPKLTKKLSLNIEPMLMKPLRNPKKSLSFRSNPSSSSLNIFDTQPKEVFPDLETILLEKSRSNQAIDATKVITPSSSEIKTSIDIGWLDRNTSSSTIEPSALSKSLSTVTSTSSFGLSNLNMNSFSSSSLPTPSHPIESKFHPVGGSDSEVIGNSDEEVEHQRHIAKKRRLTNELLTVSLPMPVIQETLQVSSVPETNEAPKPLKKIPEKPKRTSIRRTKVEETKSVDDEDREVESPDAPVMQRKRSVIKRSKDGIAKLSKKATKLMTRSKKQVESDDEVPAPEEEPINFLIDSDLSSMTTVPRASQKELKNTEKLFDNYLRQHEASTSTSKIIKIVDAKTQAKKEALEKKVASGTLNENYVRVNLKKKVFVRGKKAFSFSKYKKGIWKGKKAAAALSGPEMDMRGCDGGVLTCFNCGGVGHFAQNCKQKGDNLLPIDADVKDESPFPTLEEAAQMAEDQKLMVHSSRPESLPNTSNNVWKDSGKNSDEEAEEVGDDKENNNGNSDHAEPQPEPIKVI